MSTIFYSVMGEGRGHAARAGAVAERLRHRHRIVIHASYDALAFLRQLFEDVENVEVREIPGLKFHYVRGRMNLTRTIAAGLHFKVELKRHVRAMAEAIQRDQPALAITDFEPILSRAARLAGCPLLSLDHQHFLIAYDLSSLPWKLRTYAAQMRPAIRMIVHGQQRTVVSAFYAPPLLPRYEHVVQVGPMLRPLVQQTQPRVGEHILCYLRSGTKPAVVDLLREIPRPVRVYGMGERPAAGNLRFLAVHQERFVADLASATAVIAAAGNQLLGEAMYFGKPFLALPEAKHYEQCINAHFLQSLGGGDWVVIERLDRTILHSFLDRIEDYRGRLAQNGALRDGVPRALAEIEVMLG